MTPADVLLPAHLAGLRVERVEVLVLGADVDGRVGLRRVGDRRRRVDPVAGRVAPEQLAGVLVEASRRGCRCGRGRRGRRRPPGSSRRGRRGRSSSPGCSTARRTAPLEAREREHLAGVVGAVEDPVVERQAALDRAGGAHLPVGLAGLAVEGVDVARLAADDHVASRPPSARSRCGPGSGKRQSSLPSLARSASASPWSTPGRALQGDRVDDPVRVGGRGGAEAADVLLPLDLALVGAERVEERVLVLEVEGAPGDDRRELEQLAGLEAPLGGVEGRLAPAWSAGSGCAGRRSRRAASRPS